MDTSKLAEFRAYLANVVLPASKDAERLADANRKHIQKLIYTNLVDRFDAMVDGMLLENCRSDFLMAALTKDMTQPITEAELVRLLVKTNNIQSAITDKLQMTLRNSMLRERHSRKLSYAFNAFEAEEYATLQPRVNVSTGSLLTKIKPQGSTVPYSVCGYADWLYSRRNAIVHGAGTSKYLKNDVAQLKKLYKCTPTTTFKIKSSSIKVAAEFYQNVASVFEEHANPVAA